MEENSNKNLKDKSISEESSNNISYSIKNNLSREKYLLELRDNGLPDLPKTKILSCEIGSLITISIYNGSPISSNISLISNAQKIFPSCIFIDDLISKSNTKNFNNNYLNN